MSISNAFNLLLSVALIVQDSHGPYIATVQTNVCTSLLFSCKFNMSGPSTD